ncbi:MAG: shikimate dehydrogenase [Candidatus Bathyarchaeia archaeon]
MEVNGRTRLYCIIGDPVEHSLSPVMHNTAFKSLGLNCIYVAFKVDAKALGEAITGLKALGVEGFNVTIPHKINVMRYLDEIDSTAREIGAVNTVKYSGGRLYGYNTDGAGVLSALEEAKVDLHGKRVALIGAGGAARAIAFALASRVEEISIINRTAGKGIELAEALKKHFGITVRAKGLDRAVLKKELAEADILINATSIGMHPHLGSPVDSDLLRPGIVVFDIVYTPLETRLLRDARLKGLKTVDGVGMLVHQGAKSLEIWLGVGPPIELMRKAVLERLVRV